MLCRKSWHVVLLGNDHSLNVLLPPPLLCQSPPSKKRKLEKARRPLSFTLPEAGLRGLQTKAAALGPVDATTALLEKTLTELRVRFTPASVQVCENKGF